MIAMSPAHMSIWLLLLLRIPSASVEFFIFSHTQRAQETIGRGFVSLECSFFEHKFQNLLQRDKTLQSRNSSAWLWVSITSSHCSCPMGQWYSSNSRIQLTSALLKAHPCCALLACLFPFFPPCPLGREDFLHLKATCCLMTRRRARFWLSINAPFVIFLLLFVLKKNMVHWCC